MKRKSVYVSVIGELEEGLVNEIWRVARIRRQSPNSADLIFVQNEVVFVCG